MTASGPAVASAWLDYQLAAGAFDADEVVLVTDDDGRELAVSPNCERLFGVRPEDVLMGRLMKTDPASRKEAAESMRRLRRLGSLEGTYRTRPPVAEAEVSFTARADKPIPGLHVSRHRRIEGDGGAGGKRGGRRPSRKPPEPTSWWDAEPGDSPLARRVA